MYNQSWFKWGNILAKITMAEKMSILKMGCRSNLQKLTTLAFLLLMCESGTHGESFNNLDKHNLTSKSTENENSVVINICCEINLNDYDDVNCNTNSEVYQPSTTLMMPAHLMAENTTSLFRTAVQVKKGCLATDMDTVIMNWNISSGRGSLFLKNGYLKVENHYYHQDEYCINGKNDTNLEISVCRQNCTGPRPCIVKCCGLDQVYNFAFTPNSPKKGCQNPGGDYFNPTLFMDFKHKSSNPKNLAPHYIEKYPSTFKYECHQNLTTILLYPRTAQTIASFTPVNLTGHPFKVREDGKILYRELDGVCSVIDPATTNACIDGISNFSPEYKQFDNDPEELVLFLCSLPPAEGETEEGGYLYGGLMILSSVFLLLTIMVYFMLWERQTVHGWTILSHTISLFLMYIFLGTSHILRVTKGHSILNTQFCFVIGVLCHFFFLSTFCWLSMISIDLWLTFRAMTPRRGASKGFKRYTLYSVLGWGIPIIIVVTGISLTKEHSELSCSTIITPGYGIQSCYLQEKALGVYLYFPIAAMMALNMFFFTVTSIMLYKYQNSTKMATKDEAQEQFYRLFFKLFFVMGILYIFELISWAVSGSGVFWYWATFDVLNILRAVAVFIIFVCKPDILWAIEQNYPKLKPILIPFACITRKRRMFARRHAESESIGLNSKTQQTIIRSSTRGSSRMD